jgi:RNA polymerase sigma-70 factor (sigma-E family)
LRAARRAGFDAFVRAEAPALFRSAYLLVGNRPEAEDLLQDALERTYRHWGRKDIDRPTAYVRRAMANLASNQWRWRSRRPRQVALTGDDQPLVADATDRVHQRHDLLGALACLPPRQRVVVVLRYWEDLSEHETARSIGCSVGSVKRHASRGLARLRQELAVDIPRPPSRSPLPHPLQPTFDTRST